MSGRLGEGCSEDLEYISLKIKYTRTVSEIPVFPRRYYREFLSGGGGIGRVQQLLSQESDDLTITPSLKFRKMNIRKSAYSENLQPTMMVILVCFASVLIVFDIYTVPQRFYLNCLSRHPLRFVT